MAVPAPIQTFIDAQADAAPGDFAGLRAVIFNGTLPSQETIAGTLEDAYEHAMQAKDVDFLIVTAP